MRRLILTLTALLMAAPSCRNINSPVEGVGITLGLPGQVSHGWLTVGDVDTVRAQGYVGGWPSILKYDSEMGPERFTYSSSAPHVAQVDRKGIVMAISSGLTMLYAAAEGVRSGPLKLTVAPPAVRLLAEPATISATVGDILAIGPP